MAKSTPKIFQATLAAQQTKVSSFGASLALHIVLGLAIASLPVIRVEQWDDSKRQVVVPLAIPRIPAVENPHPPQLQPQPRVPPQPPASPEKVRVRRFETPAPERIAAPSPAAAPIERPPLLAQAPAPVLPRVEPPPAPALEPPVRTGLLPSAASAPPRQEQPKLPVQAGKFAEVELEGIQRRSGVATRTGVFEVAADTRPAPTAAQRRTVAAANFGRARLASAARGQTRGKVATASSFGAATVRAVLGKVSGTVRPAAFEEIVAGRQPRERPPAKPKEKLSSLVQITAVRKTVFEGSITLVVTSS